MQITLYELKNLEEPLSRLINQRLPIKVAYRLSKMLTKVTKELSTLETHRQALIKEFGDVSEDGQSIAITDPEKLKLFQEQFMELLQENIELNYEPVSIQLISDDVDLTVQDIALLSPLFTD